MKGLRHGKGIIYYKNGDILYEGDFLNNKYEGKGRHNLENGNYYIGEFWGGLRNGKGILYNKNGSIIYEGDFENDEYQGQ